MHDNGIRKLVVERVEARRGRLHLYERLVPERTAFVVIDMQNAFVEPGAPVEVPMARAVVPAINLLAGEMRARNVAVVWITSAFTQAGCRTDWENFFNHIVASETRDRTLAYMSPGAKGTLLWHELDARDGDIFLVKNRYSALAGGASPLERTLRSRDIDTVLIAGTKTNVCCEATARTAFDTDFKPVLLNECCAALSDEEHRASLENAIQQFADVMTCAEVLECLDLGDSATGSTR